MKRFSLLPRCLLCAILLLAGCSPRRIALDWVSTAITTGAGGVFASDNDPQFVGAALPFTIKSLETLAAQRPTDARLLGATAQLLTLYAVAFIQMPADTLTDPVRRREEYERARSLLRRGRDYGLRALAVHHPGIDTLVLRGSIDSAAALLGPADTTALYWTGAAWAAELTTGQPGLRSLFAFPRIRTLMERMLELNPSFDEGSVHDFFISFYTVAPRSLGGDTARARFHFEQSLHLSQGTRAAPYVTWAHRACVRYGDRAGFAAALQEALAIPVDRSTPQRLSNMIHQEYARWLLRNEAALFNG